MQKSSSNPLAPIARQADAVMAGTLAASAAAALAIGQHYGNLGLAAAVGGMLLAAGLLAAMLARGSALSMFVLTACNVSMVALHIQLGRGTLEFHFGVFVLLGVLLVYRDWRPVVFAAALFAVHHIGFDRLQAAGFGFYCTPQADFLKILMHAGYVVAQTSVEIVLALRLRQAAVESAELSALLQAVDRGDGALHLDVAALPMSGQSPRALQAVLLRMATAVQDVSRAAATIEAATADVAAGNLDLSRRTEAQAGSVQQTAASMEQLSGTVRSSADTALAARERAAQAAQSAQTGGQTVGDVIQTMEGIATSSRKIADIIGVIDSIAFQTNILALNAAVEAARAGEQGRGFAVVASEVRSLAGRSAEAARQIKQLISSSVEQVEEGTRQVDVAGASMKDLVAQVQAVAEMIGQLSTAAQEQAGGIRLVDGAVVELDRATQQNAALVEQGAAAAQSLKQQAAQLAGVVRVFRLA